MSPGRRLISAARRRLPALLGSVVALIGLAGAVAGCGADQNGDQISPPIPATTQTGVRPGGSSRADESGTVPTSSASGSTSTTPQPGTNRPTVLLGDMNTPEQFVIGELYAWALRAQGYHVAVSRNIGPPAVAQQALHQHSLDVYPDYLNDYNRDVAGIRTTFDTLGASISAARGYARTHGMVLLNPTPFSNTTGLAVTTWFARENKIWSLPQLSRGPRVIVGAPPQYTQATDGLPALENAYGLRPAVVQPLPIGAQYDDLTNNVIQAAYVQTTDPELDGFTYLTLADPLHASGIGNVVPVTTPRVIAEEGPAFVATLNRVDALLTLSAVRGLNAEVEVYKADPALVAEEFLQANGMVPQPSTPGDS